MTITIYWNDKMSTKESIICTLESLAVVHYLEARNELYYFLDGDKTRPTKDHKDHNGLSIEEQNHLALDDCLERHRGNKAKVARELGIDRRTIYAWLEKRNGATPMNGATNE